ncbi:MAG: carbohydrate-binding module family 14 protein [Dysgonamonadaceae bacterium]|nr:carbohydrate-binding module family 14 protein [Dysgonamonadaceae bacterium]
MLSGSRACCSKYYECSNGIAYHHSCQEGLHWNNTIKCCDWPDTAGCVSGDDCDNDDGIALGEFTLTCGSNEGRCWHGFVTNLPNCYCHFTGNPNQFCLWNLFDILN